MKRNLFIGATVTAAALTAGIVGYLVYRNKKKDTTGSTDITDYIVKQEAENIESNPLKADDNESDDIEIEITETDDADDDSTDDGSTPEVPEEDPEQAAREYREELISQHSDDKDREMVCYYGCPNSKKVKGLNLAKRKDNI